MAGTTTTFIWAVVSTSSIVSPVCFAVYRWAAAGAANARTNEAASASRSNFFIGGLRWRASIAKNPTFGYLAIWAFPNCSLGYPIGALSHPIGSLGHSTDGLWAVGRSTSNVQGSTKLLNG